MYILVDCRRFCFLLCRWHTYSNIFLAAQDQKKKKENYVNVVQQQTLTFVILILWMQFFTEILRHRLHLCLSLRWNTREGRIRREQMAGVGRCMCLYVQRYVCSVQCDFWTLANFLHKYLCILMAKFTLFFWFAFCMNLALMTVIT